MPIKALIWNDLATGIISSPDSFCCLPPSGWDEAKSERPRQALSTVIKLIFEGFAGLALRSDGAVTVRVVGYWAPGAHEPWWVATSESGPAKDVLALYDRRMTVEEQFRDTKGRRFGAKLFWTQFRDPEALARFVTLLAVALLIWTLAGIVSADMKPSLRLRCRRKGPRQSFVTIGIRAVAQASFSARFDRESIPLIPELPTMRLLHALAASK